MHTQTPPNPLTFDERLIVLHVKIFFFLFLSLSDFNQVTLREFTLTSIVACAFSDASKCLQLTMQFTIRK